MVIFSLSMNRVLANDETQTERSIARSLTQNSEGCGGIIGKVFNDANRNEFQDANETGLPGTRLVTQNGLQLITDDAGRFNSGCIFISTINSHTTILLKLDPQSLPTNYYLKGGNLRETILSQGQIATIDIGVSRVRIVQLTLRSSAFENKTINLKSTWLKNIERLIKVLDAEPSVLRLTYFGTAQDIELTKKRTVFLKQFIQERRKKLDHNSKLPIEIRLVSANG